MRLLSTLLVVTLLAAAALFSLFAVPDFAAAIAQEVASTKVDLAPAATSLAGYVSAAISAIVVFVIGVISARIYSWLGINIEAKHREALHSAIMTGVNAGLARVSDIIGGQAVDVKSTAVAEAVNYVLGSVPDAVKFFGLSEVKLGEMVTAKLTAVQIGGAPLPKAAAT